jgi:uncharacterized NAD(P)/FAD-binding protein YdhS
LRTRSPTFSNHGGRRIGAGRRIGRRGRLPRAHAPKGVVPQSVHIPQFRRLSSLTAAARIACEAAEAHGSPWQGVINGVRGEAQTIWQALPVADQARFLRHLRPFWDTHRHRLPPEVHDQLQREFATGGAILRKGRVIAVERQARGFEVKLARLGSATEETLETDLVFDCTGHRPDLSSPFLQHLLEQGFARADRHQLGLAIKPNGEILAGEFGATPHLFALGPLGQGTLWEITSVPEIVRQADAAASTIAEATLLEEAKLA